MYVTLYHHPPKNSLGGYYIPCTIFVSVVMHTTVMNEIHNPFLIRSARSHFISVLQALKMIIVASALSDGQAKTNRPGYLCEVFAICFQTLIRPHNGLK